MEENNLCFIDGQNLYIGTRIEKDSWNIDLNKLRKYASSLYKKLTSKYFDYLINIKHILKK